MKNTLISYNTESIKTKEKTIEVMDYFSKDVYIADLKDDPEIKDLLRVIRVQDDDTFEKISYRLYNSSNYWDIILLLNNRDPLFDTAYNFDVLEKYSEDRLQDIVNDYTKKENPLDEEYQAVLKDKYLDEAMQENEKMRILSVPRPEQINSLIMILKKRGYL